MMIKRSTFALVMALLLVFLWTQYKPKSAQDQTQAEAQAQSPAIDSKTNTNAKSAEDTAQGEAASPAADSGEQANAKTDKLSADSRRRISALIDRLADLDDASLIRDGMPYDMAQTKAHLKRKWHLKNDQISDPEQFIEVVATGSSMTGEPYILKIEGQPEEPLAQWLHEALAEIE